MSEYSRDYRSPKPSSEIASKIMSSIRAKNTKPEKIFRKYLWANNIKGYRLHWKIEGKPDIAFVSKKTAIFIHGCYWHRCPKCNPHKPKSNSKFWSEKFKKNVERDIRKKTLLKDQGWAVFTFWECEIKDNPQNLVDQVKDHLNKIDKI